jgi:hypothetical protein
LPVADTDADRRRRPRAPIAGRRPTAARARLYAARAAGERSLMARGIFATAAAESRK